MNLRAVGKKTAAVFVFIIMSVHIVSFIVMCAIFIASVNRGVVKGKLNCLTSLDVFYFFFFNSCCSDLEHRTSVKLFVSLQSLNLRHSIRLLERGDQPIARPLPNTNTE
jgi:hypothetical protein